MKLLSRFDTFSKAEDHVQTRTLCGGIVSLIAGMIVVYLFFSEFFYYRTVHRDSHVFVDSATAANDLVVSIDIEVFAIACKDADIQIKNKRGDHSELDLDKTPSGDSGCRLKGTFPIPRIAGIFQISSHPLSQNSNFLFNVLSAENVRHTHTHTHTHIKVQHDTMFVYSLFTFDVNGDVGQREPHSAPFVVWTGIRWNGVPPRWGLSLREQRVGPFPIYHQRCSDKLPCARAI